jgi:aldehyde:ferredoxin oxidoreductase
MSELFGATGKLLRVDLTTKSITVDTIPEKVIKAYLGGNTMGLYYLLKEQKAGIDPLSPEAMITFMASFATGTPGPGLSRLCIVAKSPVTGGYGETEGGGWWAPEMKFAGYDGIIVTGKSETPVYLAIKDDVVELRPADHLWGVKLKEAQETIKDEMGDPKTRVALIGPAGEKQNVYACVINELKHANGRTGMGAVMGAKNLKAIAVRGTTKKLPLFDEEGAKALVKEMMAEWKAIPNTFPTYGTMRGVRATQDVGVLPTYNFREGQFKDFENLAERTYMETILKKTGTCYRCPISCKREVEFEDGGFKADPAYGGSEFETTMAFGTCTGVGDLKPISAAHQMCQEYGLDTISPGVMIAWLMECVENGLIKPDQLDGLEPRFGDAETMLKLLEKICKRDGVGDVLARGFRAAIEHFGPETEKFAMHVKNSTFPAHDPRGKAGLALAYALPSAGPDHMEVQHDHIMATEGGASLYEAIGITEPLDATDIGPKKVRNFFVNQSLYNGYNAIGMCYFCVRPNGPFTINGIAKYLRLVTGWEHTNLWNLVKVGEKHSTMSRIFNLREGVTAKDDRLPERMFTPLEGTGPVAGKSIDREEFEQAKKTYYAMNMWDDEGVPTEACLYHHELDWLVGAYPGSAGAPA